MFITITTSRGTPEQLQAATTFLSSFLPRLEQHPGVIAVYHYTRPEHGDDTTLIIWENEDAVRAYRASDLVREAIVFEQANNLPATREGYPLEYPA
ncbi:MAG TPA: antibiotic biosynthesis monooxygenase [Ktedonobacterales bacterium]